MANNYFQFRQFTIFQDQCAMKVCTDACIFGAFVTQYINNFAQRIESILDIGTGTGLLSLMMAQKTSAAIDAVEIDQAAFLQAKQNFEASSWNKRLHISNCDALQFQPGKKYDGIISNPPFFERDLKSGDKKKDSAKHDTTFTLQQLLHITSQHLSDSGFFAVLLPYHRVDFFKQIASTAHFHLTGQLLIQHTGNRPFFRGILIFSREKSDAVTDKLIIKNDDGTYTAEFTRLLKDYYLHL